MDDLFLASAFPAPLGKIQRVQVSPIVQLPEVSTWKPEEQPSAFDAFALYHNALKHRKVVSRVVHELSSAVLHAELAVQSAGPKGVKLADEETNGLIAKVQLATFQAADWLRRFSTERHLYGVWNMVVEDSLAHNIVNKLDELTASMHAKLQVDTKAIADHVARWKKVDEKEEKTWAASRDAFTLMLKNFVDLYEKQNVQRRVVLNVLLRELKDARAPMGPEFEALLTRAATLVDLSHGIKSVPLKSVGPFGLKFFKVSDGDIVLNTTFDAANLSKSGQSYTCTGPGSALSGGPKTGPMSSIYELPLKKGDAGRKLFRLPEDAHYYAWAFGVSPAAPPKLELDLFVASGGLVCWNKSGKVLGISALVAGSALQFQSPRPLPQAVVDKLSWTEARVPCVEVLGLSWAWVGPNEHGLVSIPLGALCTRSNDGLTCYFGVCPAEKVSGMGSETFAVTTQAEVHKMSENALAALGI